MGSSLSECQESTLHKSISSMTLHRTEMEVLWHITGTSQVQALQLPTALQDWPLQTNEMVALPNNNKVMRHSIFLHARHAGPHQASNV